MDDRRAFPDEDYRFTLGLAPVGPAEFFQAWPDGRGGMAERRRILAENPAPYVAATSDSGSLVRAFETWSRDWATPPDTPAKVAAPSNSAGLARDPANTVRALGMSLEPDFVLLAPDGAGVFRVVAGCVCFPSSWRLEEKVGLTVAEVHTVVPGLNAALAMPIEKLLAGLKPGKSWGRSNWGLSGSPQLDQHPHHGLPAIAANAAPEAIWLRQEHQLLAALPGGEGVVFGIRIEQTTIAEVLQLPEWSHCLARGLATLPPEMIDYKRLTAIQAPLVARLQAAAVRITREP